MEEEYFSILFDCEYELVEKKSRFIANLFHIESEEQAKEKIKDIAKKHFNAKHNVFAYRIYEDNSIIEKYSDNGEPSGTAGKPILDMLKAMGICNVLIVVTRYFGGILLGTGGLVRAYTGSAKLCLDNSKIDTLERCCSLKVFVDYEEIGKIKHFCEKNNYIIEKTEYLEKISLNILVKKCKEKIFYEELKNFLNRDVDITALEDKFVKK